MENRNFLVKCKKVAVKPSELLAAITILLNTILLLGIYITIIVQDGLSLRQAIVEGVLLVILQNFPFIWRTYLLCGISLMITGIGRLRAYLKLGSIS